MVKWSGHVLDLGLPIPLSFCPHLPGLGKVYSLSMPAALSLNIESLNRYRRIPCTIAIWKDTEWGRVLLSIFWEKRRHNTDKKPYFLFSNVLKRWSFQKKLHWNMIFPVSSRKMIFLSPENMILFFRRKMINDLSQKKKKKKKWKYDIFFKCYEKMIFLKKWHWNMIFLIPWGKMAFLFHENMIFFYGREMKDDISQKIHGNMMFSVYW